MKYYSEILDKLFNTEKELAAAEQSYKAEQDKLLETRRKLSVKRKQLCEEIDKAKAERDDAWAKYVKATNDIAKLNCELERFDGDHPEVNPNRDSVFDSIVRIFKN